MSTASRSFAPPPRSFHDPAASLRRHVQDCRLARSRWFPAAACAERLHGIVAPRFVTTVTLAAALLALACGWL
jgi:hypothetical protein